LHFASFIQTFRLESFSFARAKAGRNTATLALPNRFFLRPTRVPRLLKEHRAGRFSFYPCLEIREKEVSIR